MSCSYNLNLPVAPPGFPEGGSILCGCRCRIVSEEFKLATLVNPSRRTSGKALNIRSSALQNLERWVARELLTDLRNLQELPHNQPASGDTGRSDHDRPEFPDRGGAGDHPGCAEERRGAEEGRRAAHSVSDDSNTFTPLHKRGFKSSQAPHRQRKNGTLSK